MSGACGRSAFGRPTHGVTLFGRVAAVSRVRGITDCTAGACEKRQSTLGSRARRGRRSQTRWSNSMVLSETVRGGADNGDALDGPHLGQPGRRRMLPSGVLWSLMRVRVTVGYAVVLITIGATLLAFGSTVPDLVVSHVSTNLHNLANGYLGTLIGSAFVTEGRDIYAILPGLVCLLALAELVWCGRRLVLTFVLGHVGATVMVAAGLAVAITAGWLPGTVSRGQDAGVSYS